MLQVWKLVCISLFGRKKKKRRRRKSPGFICQNSQRGGVWVGTQCSMVLPCGKGENKLCFASLTSTTLSLFLLLVWKQTFWMFWLVFFFPPQKFRYTHNTSQHLGIIVALRVYILMVKGKKIIKSYFEDGRPSNQSVFRQCVFK